MGRDLIAALGADDYEFRSAGRTERVTISPFWGSLNQIVQNESEHSETGPKRR